MKTGAEAVAYEAGKRDVLDRITRGLQQVRDEASYHRSVAEAGVRSGRAREDVSPLWYGGHQQGLLDAARIIDEKLR